MTDTQRNADNFGANAWLVDDMYEQYRQDPQSVSESWRDFFEDYRPGGANLARPSSPEVKPPTDFADEEAADGSGAGSAATATAAPTPGRRRGVSRPEPPAAASSCGRPPPLRSGPARPPAAGGRARRRPARRRRTGARPGAGRAGRRHQATPLRGPPAASWPT